MLSLKNKETLVVIEQNLEFKLESLKKEKIGEKEEIECNIA